MEDNQLLKQQFRKAIDDLDVKIRQAEEAEQQKHVDKLKALIEELKESGDSEKVKALKEQRDQLSEAWGTLAMLKYIK